MITEKVLGAYDRRVEALLATMGISIAIHALTIVSVPLMRPYMAQAMPETVAFTVVLVALAVLLYVTDRSIHLAFSFGFGGAMIALGGLIAERDVIRNDRFMWVMAALFGFAIMYRCATLSRISKAPV